MDKFLIDGQEQIFEEIEPTAESLIDEATQKKKELMAELLEYFAFIQDKENRVYVFWLHLLGFTRVEIADRLGVSVEAVRLLINNMVSRQYPISFLLKEKFSKPCYLKSLLKKREYNERHGQRAA